MKRKKAHGFAIGLIATAVVFALVFCGAVRLVAFVSDSSLSGETETVRRAVHAALMTCYATEGGYPADISYLRKNYGLSYDEENYIVCYDAFASNILPDVVVLEAGEGM